MNYLGSSGNRGEIKSAIHQLLGLNLLQRTIEDLESQSVSGRFKKELREDADEEMQRLLDELENLEKQRESARALIESNEKQVGALRREVDAISAKLEANREVQDLQKERRNLEEEIRKLNPAIQDADKELRRIVSEEALFLFTGKLVDDGRNITSNLPVSGRIPARVLKDFIDDLLREGKCICERCLEPGSPEHNAVIAKRNLSPDASFNDAVSSVDNALGAMDGKLDLARRHLREAYRRLGELDEHCRQKKSRTEEISEQIGDRDDEEVRDLEHRREHALQDARV